MQNKIFGLVLGVFFCTSLWAEEVVTVELDSENDISVEMEELSADAVENYQVEGSLFQQITDLEQEKILMQLEKERAQLDLELDRLAAEKIKLHMEIDTLSGRAEQQQQEIENEKAKLEAEAARLMAEKEKIVAEAASVDTTKSYIEPKPQPKAGIGDKYKLVNVVGAGSQLQATLADLTTGQNKRVSVGKKIDGMTVKSISLDEGVVFVDGDGETQTLYVSNGN
ncbi:MAG: hypothetical protein J6R22_02130 [Alphaproteobacteria bacterium]|nr:hypothetical protein [Alphaproteobacteria bacterium]